MADGRSVRRPQRLEKSTSDMPWTSFQISCNYSDRLCTAIPYRQCRAAPQLAHQVADKSALCLSGLWLLEIRRVQQWSTGAVPGASGLMQPLARAHETHGWSEAGGKNVTGTPSASLLLVHVLVYGSRAV